MESNYNKYPIVPVRGYTGKVFEGWAEILENIEKERLESDPTLVVVECYHGLFHDEIKKNLGSLEDFTLVDVSEAYKSPGEIEKMVYPDVTDDPVFGRLTELTIEDFFDEERLSILRREITSGSLEKLHIVLYGIGASFVSGQWDLIIYADMARWEIQKRMRSNLVNNIGMKNKNDQFSAQYKRGYFVDWRVCDKIKIQLLDRLDYLLDTNIPDRPKMISGDMLRLGLKEVSHRPFRLVPFFDPGPWGGQWMKEVCDLDRNKPNFAWCFDCVPEENSLMLCFDGISVEIPSLDLIFYQPVEVLGQEVYDLLGPEFPIRFDFLDTMDGGNLSLQVHPSVSYIREKFGLTYTQDESYYLLDAKDDAVVYLGLKEGIDPDAMIEDLKKAQEGDQAFDAKKYVQTWEVKKHDHILIPAGTVHCSGKNSMVLEISATPYIFTFKLWDWGRMGLDGKPRPIHINHGKEVIKWNRTSSWTRENLVNQIRKVSDNNVYTEEVTGLHESEFIETRRHWFTDKVSHHTNGLVNVLNLVEGREVIVESPMAAFEPFVIHYAETFVVPAAVEHYTIRPYGEGQGMECATIKASVRIEALRRLGDDLRMMKLLEDTTTSDL